MAEDVVVLLNYLKWTEERSVHVVGLSMGGMIAQGSIIVLQIGWWGLHRIQELADRISERIISLSLIVTTAGSQFMLNVPPVDVFFR